ncbi:MAG: S-layer homology domain-containing protein, partial [Oscillospiraceae bacterium]|nr:S-layer homology domain-containing protein [Oscillospiraceae bacterium]
MKLKKLLCLALALVLTLGCLTGATLAAETEELHLRPGHTVEVETDSDFLAAYKKLYEPNSTVNMIRLIGSFTAYNVSLRTAGGNDPWMSGFEGTLCVRMPEGTCLDLNGNTIAIRANQGYDDNGTGKPSNNVSVGKVIDTYGGGCLNFYVITENNVCVEKYIQRGLDLAAAYAKDVATKVSISKPTPDAASHEYTIPYNVCLRFSGTDSSFPAKKVTFKSGATVEIAYPDSAAVMKEAGEVVFECANEADKSRTGIQVATKTVDVTDAAPARAQQTYQIVAEELYDAATAVQIVQPPVIENADAAATEAAVIKNPSATPYTFPETYTREQLQQVIVETAKAYYYHDPYVQYDGRTVTDNGKARHGDKASPEDAAVDSIVYTVCSNYCEKNYYNGMDFQLFGGTTRTRTWCCYPTGTPGVAYQYIGPETPATVTEGEKDLEKALVDAVKALQPGDIIVGADSIDGHAMMYVGDCFGDGTKYILHSTGKSYVTDTFEDLKEGPGSITLTPMDKGPFAAGGSWDLRKPGHSAMGFAILRPLDDPLCPKKPSASGASRLLFPSMDIRRDTDRIKYTATLPGEEIPVTVTITNRGKQDYKELPVLENLPENAALVEGSVTNGAKIEGKTIRWSVKIPAGKSIQLTYQVKMPTAVGESVTFPKGKVAEIPTRETSLVVGGKELTAAQQNAIMNYAATAATESGSYRDLDYFNRFYGKALGLDVGLPKTTAELIGKLMQQDGKYLVPKTTVAAEDAALARMVLPQHYTGRFVPLDSVLQRVRDYNREFYQPGDLFVCLKDKNTNAVKDVKDVDLLLYLGGGRVLSYTAAGAKPETFSATLNFALKYNVLLCLRPTLAYEDINTRVYVDKLPFTDVTEADWFYTYVKDLVDDGTVNGMTPTTFVPKGDLTYGQALKLVTLAAGAEEQEALAGGHWASGYQRYAARQGWIGGTVNLDAKITRLEFCQIAAKAKGLTEQPATNPFKDTTDTAVLALNKVGVINGMSADTFAPNDLLTRAQISKIIWTLR